MKKTILILGIINLLIGASIVSSSYNDVKDIQSDFTNLKSMDDSKDIQLSDNTVYAYCAYDPTGQLVEGAVYFELDEPGNITNIPNLNPGGLSGGTWANYGEWFVCEPLLGYIWKIDVFTGDALFLGGGGEGLTGLTYDPIYDELYGCSSTGLYKIDQYSGAQTFIGSFSSGPVNMIGIACDTDGVLYGWDTGTDRLWAIDLETAECYLVGPLGIDITNYQQDGHFDFSTDTLYLAAYTYIGELYECDKDTGECYLVGNFQGGAELTAFAIPYDCNPPPVTTISLDPPYPNGWNGWYISNVTVTLDSWDENGVNATYYRVNNEDWNIYDIPFIISEEGDNILIEYYSVDNLGNIEDVKSKTLDIDKTPPNATLNYTIIKIGHNKWMITFTVIIDDNQSAINRVRFLLNGVEQEVVVGPGPVYTWSIIYGGGIKIIIGAEICDSAGNCVTLEVEIKFNRNNIKQSIRPLFYRFIDHLQLLHRLLDI